MPRLAVRALFSLCAPPCLTQGSFPLGGVKMGDEDATCLFDWFIEPVLSRDASGERNELQLLGERVGGAGYFGFTAWGVRQTAERQRGDPGDGAVADQPCGRRRWWWTCAPTGERRRS
eukprot:ctg_1271.g313